MYHIFFHFLAYLFIYSYVHTLFRPFLPLPPSSLHHPTCFQAKPVLSFPIFSYLSSLLLLSFGFLYYQLLPMAMYLRICFRFMEMHEMLGVSNMLLCLISLIPLWMRRTSSYIGYIQGSQTRDMTWRWWPNESSYLHNMSFIFSSTIKFVVLNLDCTRFSYIYSYSSIYDS
jgi:hypothetical protein